MILLLKPPQIWKQIRIWFRSQCTFCKSSCLCVSFLQVLARFMKHCVGHGGAKRKEGLSGEVRGPQIELISAVSCSLNTPRLGGVGFWFGFWLTGRLGRAWVSAWVVSGLWWWGGGWCGIMWNWKLPPSPTPPIQVVYTCTYPPTPQHITTYTPPPQPRHHPCTTLCTNPCTAQPACQPKPKSDPT